MLRDLNKNQKFEADEIFTYTKDHLGSVRDITNNNAELVQRYDFSSYGITKLEKDPANPTYKFIENSYTYTGQDYDIETGLTLHGVRWYDSTTGRFLSEEPSGMDGPNFYWYGRSNPVKNIDPTGEFAIVIALAGFSALDIALGLGLVTSSAILLDQLINVFSKQDKKLGKGEIDKLKDAGIDVEGLKGNKSTGKLDLFKDKQGNIKIKPKSGQGPGEPTGLNIKDFKSFFLDIDKKNSCGR